LVFGKYPVIFKELKNTDTAWAEKMRGQLLASAAGDQEFNLFTSADFALQMVEGAPRVRFFVHT
jgi:hypothetical protein